MSEYCQTPPKGWICSRCANHEGPCEARQIDFRSLEDLRELVRILEASNEELAAKDLRRGRHIAELLAKVKDLRDMLVRVQETDCIRNESEDLADEVSDLLK